MTGNPYIKYSPKCVDDFIKDKEIVKFFVEDLEDKLKKYDPGDINMKPDVLKQIKELDIKRKEMENKMMEERQKNSDSLNKNKGKTIVVQEEGKPPRELNHSEVVEMLTSQQKQLSQMGQLKDLYETSARENIRLKGIIEIQQKILDDKNLYISELETKVAESSEVIVVNVDKN
jgi:hypothetical protein